MLIKRLDRKINETIVPVKLKSMKYSGDVNYKVVEIDYDNDEQINTWCSICNSAYSDADYSLTEGRSFLKEHPVMCENKTVFFLNEHDSPIATVSYGVYKADRNCGGLFRIAVLPEYQGKGIGAYLISYGCTRLFEEGVLRIEDVIKYKRKKSLTLHYRLGFVPEDINNCAAQIYSKPKSIKTKLFRFLMNALLLRDKLVVDLRYRS